jgi:hypothetical protein
MTTETDELGMVMIEDEAPGPVTVPKGDDPWAVLRAMQKFMPGTVRGECEIMGTGGGLLIGLTILTGHPERIAQPVFDCRTRGIEVIELAAWLQARGFEASACQWDRPNGALNGNALTGSLAIDGNRRWRLITGPARLPPQPATHPTAQEIMGLGQMQAAAFQNLLAAGLGGGMAGSLGSPLGGPAGTDPLKGR